MVARSTALRAAFFSFFGCFLDSSPKKILPLHCWVYVRQYCAKIDEAARNRMELIVPELAKRNGVTEQLKAENQMEWVRQMNSIRNRVSEIVYAKIIFSL